MKLKIRTPRDEGPLISPILTSNEEKPLSAFRAQLHEIIFEADTFGGKAFDIALLKSRMKPKK